jgi:DNA topoisomerase IA
MADTLEKYSPIILDEKLTKEMNEELEAIEESKKRI